MENEIPKLDKLNTTAIFYTDGSFRPNHEGSVIGFWGSGAHGYIFNNNPDNKTVSDKPTKFYITDNGYILNEEWNKYKDKVKEVKPIAYIDACYSFLNRGSINTGELSAVIELLKDLAEKQPDLKLDFIKIKTDSMYVVYEMTKILEGKTEIEDEDKANKEFLEELIKVMSEFKKLGVTLEVMKVKGHSDDPGNDLADMLAVYARLQSSNRNIFRMFNIHNYGDKTKYWNYSLERHPLLEYKQLFFTNALKGTNEDVYYTILDYKTDKEPGTKTHDACFGLVNIKERQNIVEDTIAAYHKACNNMSVISTLDLNLLYSRLNSYYFNLLGDTIYNFLYKTFSLTTLNKNNIVYSIKPPGLANQALERTYSLHRILDEYKRGNHNPNSKRKFIDITDLVYEKITDKKDNTKYSCIIPQTSDYILYNYGNIPIHIMLGKDTLGRNQFKHLEKDKPKVTLVLFEKTPDIIDYYTIVETETGDLGIFCNFYSGKVLRSRLKKNKK